MLAKITRTYGGLEGRRVKAGTVYAVGEPQGDLPVMSLARFRQLQQQRLAEEYTLEGNPAAPGAKPAPTPPRTPARAPGAKVEPDSRPPAVKTPTARARARKKTQADAPKEPRPLARRPAGGPAGKGEPASSSQEVRQVGSVTLTQRGTRRRTPGGSSSTTPTASPPGQTSSTPATPSGGTSTTQSPPDSAAFE